MKNKMRIFGMACSKKMSIVLIFVLSVIFVLGAADRIVYCRYCGYKASSIRTLTSNKCLRHPGGAFAGFHVLYEGSVKNEYFCKHCGHKAKTIQTLTANKCLRHPNGAFKGRHEPAL